jgi:hypothetical protein
MENIPYRNPRSSDHGIPPVLWNHNLHYKRSHGSHTEPYFQLVQFSTHPQILTL